MPNGEPCLNCNCTGQMCLLSAEDKRERSRYEALLSAVAIANGRNWATRQAQRRSRLSFQSRLVPQIRALEIRLWFRD
jgi:hypothetical protein